MDRNTYYAIAAKAFKTNYKRVQQSKVQFSLEKSNNSIQNESHYKDFRLEGGDNLYSSFHLGYFCLNLQKEN